MSTKNRWRWILLVSLLVLGSIVGLQLAFFKNGPDNTKKDEKKKDETKKDEKKDEKK